MLYMIGGTHTLTLRSKGQSVVLNSMFLLDNIKPEVPYQKQTKEQLEFMLVALNIICILEIDLNVVMANITKAQE